MSFDSTLSSRLSICIFPWDEKQAQSLSISLSENSHNLKYINSTNGLKEFIEPNKEKIDCLVFFRQNSFIYLFSQLAEQGTLIPMVIVEDDELIDNSSSARDKENLSHRQTEGQSSFLYHSAEVRLRRSQLEKLPSFINLAISKFLHLAPSCSLKEKSSELKAEQEDERTNFLLLQQRRLSEKLKERLGYLGVYYKRNSQEFYRNLSEAEKQDFLNELSQDYRQIILNYFVEDPDINQAIDRFVNKAFFADFSVSQILEIHMELMDEFSQQLKLEGRSEEILLDYRLALIDIIAHLCEMYRRSIPREDIHFDLLFGVD